MHVMRCPYCVEGGNFKVMIGQSAVRSMRASGLADESVL